MCISTIMSVSLSDIYKRLPKVMSVPLLKAPNIFLYPTIDPTALTSLYFCLL